MSQYIFLYFSPSSSRFSSYYNNNNKKKKKKRKKRKVKKKENEKKKNLEAVSGKHSIDSLQKTAILGTSHNAESTAV